jgi:hypothetical protein
MSNNAQLLNTPSRVSDTSILEGDWLGVASAAYCIPIPWFFMFGPHDLESCTIYYNTYVELDGERISKMIKANILNPSCSVVDAKLNLANARHLFDVIADDAEVGSEYFVSVLSQLDSLPYPFLTIDATEVLLMDDVKLSSEKFARAFSRNADSIDLIKDMSCYVDKDLTSHAQALAHRFFEPEYRIRCSRSVEARREWDLILAEMPFAW